MQINKFNTLMAQHGDAYILYKTPDRKGLSYLVGTTDFSKETSPYVFNRFTKQGSKMLAQLKDNEVLVFSWTNDKFRVLELPSIKRVTTLGLNNG